PRPADAALPWLPSAIRAVVGPRADLSPRAARVVLRGARRPFALLAPGAASRPRHARRGDAIHRWRARRDARVPDAARRGVADCRLALRRDRVLRDSRRGSWPGGFHARARRPAARPARISALPPTSAACGTIPASGKATNVREAPGWVPREASACAVPRSARAARALCP